MKLGKLADKVRSKNAGPFWLTLDIFCGDAAVFRQVSEGLASDRVAALLGADVAVMKRFDMPELNVVKFSVPRPARQGAIDDRDMHGASFANLLAEMEI